MSARPGNGGSDSTRAAQSATVESWLKSNYLNYRTKIVDEDARTEFTISTKQFLDILRLQGDISWFETEAIDLALSQLIDIHERTDCYVLSTFYAAMLCRFGTGEIGQNVLPDSLLTILQDEGKRFIIVPCNDGMLMDTDSTSSQLLGTHWGLMIIDSKKETARWLDGLLEIQSKEKNGNRVVYIQSMFGAGTAAGKILCGYDRLLGLIPGHFDASTIKWTPHQRHDNTGPRDDGACGPHAFACLNHLLETPDALEDIYAHFRRGNPAPGNFRRGRRGFNSSTTRKLIADQIREERERVMTESASEPSLALNADLLNILGLRVTTEAALRACNRLNPASGNRTAYDAVNRPDEIDATKRSDLEQSYNAQWLRDKEDVEMQNVFKAQGINSMSKYTKWRESQKAPKISGGKATGTRRIFLGDRSYNVPIDDGAIWPPHTTDKNLWLADATELPKFSSMNSTLAEKWLKKNPGLKKEYDDMEGDKNPTTRKAMLHHEFRKTFLGESDDSCIKYWIKDSSVFGSKKQDSRQAKINEATDRQRKAGLIRLAMMLHYEDEPAVRKVKSAHQGDGGGGNGKPDDNGGKGDGSNPNGPGGLPKDPDLPSDIEGDALTSSYNEKKPAGNNNPNSNGPKSNNGGGSTINVSPGSTHRLPTGLLNYPLMPEEQLELEKAKYKEKANDPRFKDKLVNNSSWRAILYVDVQKGRFENDSDAICQDVWLKDSVVFNTMERIALSALTATKQTEISRRMGEHYYVRPPEVPGEPSGASKVTTDDGAGSVVLFKPTTSDVVASPSKGPRQKGRENAQTHLTGLENAAKLLSQTAEQRLLSIDCTPHGSGDGSSSSRSTLTWPSDSSSEGGPSKTIGKHSRGSDDDPEGKGRTSKKPRLEVKPPFEDETIEIFIGRQPYILDASDTSIFLPFDTTREHWPAGTTELPNFSNLTSMQLNQWRRANLDVDLPAYLGINDFTTALAMLHMRLKRTFMHEPDENFTSSWINDGEVFTEELRTKLRSITNDLFRNGEIRRYMMAAYEPDMLRRVEAMPKPKLDNPNITVQRGSQKDPESFKSDVHVGQKPVPKRREGVDRTRLSPNAAGAREGRARYGMRKRPKQSKKKRGSP